VDCCCCPFAYAKNTPNHDKIVVLKKALANKVQRL